MKGLASNLIIREKIELSEAKSKELRSLVEKLITRGKKQNLASLRYLLSYLPKKSAEKVYYQISPRYKSRQGGYTRIIKMTTVSKKDSAQKAIIEFV